MGLCSTGWWVCTEALSLIWVCVVLDDGSTKYLLRIYLLSLMGVYLLGLLQYLPRPTRKIQSCHTPPRPSWQIVGSDEVSTLEKRLFLHVKGTMHTISPSRNRVNFQILAYLITIDLYSMALDAYHIDSINTCYTRQQ